MKTVQSTKETQTKEGKYGITQGNLPVRKPA